MSDYKQTRFFEYQIASLFQTSVIERDTTASH